MDGREIEPRKTVWALAEIHWQEPDGTSARAPATLEDTSISGACVRVKRAFAVGSRLTIKWRREEFSAIAKNCRNDGRDFLLGVRRDSEPKDDKAHTASPGSTQAASKNIQTDANKRPQWASDSALPPVSSGARQQEIPSAAANHVSSPLSTRAELRRPENRTRLPIPVAKSPPSRSAPAGSGNETRSHSERKVMPPKSFIPQFWRRERAADTPVKTISREVPVNKSTTHASDTLTGRNNELLSYEDVYRAAGIMSPGSKYDIHKVVDMLNSERIRDLSKEVKRASVLMALDAAGTSADDLLTEATRRQNALHSYEAAQRKQLEEFEAIKAQENARIEEEMEKIRAHYGERIQKNLDLVAKEKEALRNWQGAMQHESQRIADVIELCGKPQTARPTAMSAAASAGSAEKSIIAGDGSLLAKPNLLGKT